MATASTISETRCERGFGCHSEKNIDKKRKPELYADFKREKGCLKGEKKINADFASHRQYNYKLSEMNGSGQWTKIEIVGPDTLLKSNYGLNLVNPIDEDIFENKNVFKSICSIDIEYDLKGKVIREKACDIDANTIYVCNYSYAETSESTIVVDYRKSDLISPFLTYKGHPVVVKYSYINNILDNYELVDVSSGAVLNRKSEVEKRLTRDEYYRVKMLAYYKNDIPYQDADSIHKINYEYDDKGEVIKEERLSVDGKVRYFYKKTPTYRIVQSLDGRITTDSLDIYGNVTWSATTLDGKLINNSSGYALTHSTYDYYDPTNSNIYNSVIRQLDSEGRLVCYTEEFYGENVKRWRDFNKDGMYIGGLDIVYDGPQKREYESIFFDVSRFGAQLRTTNDTIKVNALAVEVIGERAKILGLKDNDIVVKLGEWTYDYVDEENSREINLMLLNRLYLQTILTAQSQKEMVVLRNIGDSLGLVKIYLPKGTMCDLQFTLFPAHLSEKEQEVLLNFHDDNIGEFSKLIYLALPKDRYLQSPNILFTSGYLLNSYDNDIRPSPLNEYVLEHYYSQGFKINMKEETEDAQQRLVKRRKLEIMIKNKRISTWEKLCSPNRAIDELNDSYFISYMTDDLRGVDMLNDTSLYNIVALPVRDMERKQIEKLYKTWIDGYYSRKQREEIVLPIITSNMFRWVLFSKSPYELMFNTIMNGNSNGYVFVRNPNVSSPEVSFDEDGNIEVVSVKIDKSSNVFIYDRLNRMAAYIER